MLTPSLLIYNSLATLVVAVGIISGGTILPAALEATTRAAPHDHHDEVVRAYIPLYSTGPYARLDEIQGGLWPVHI
jgi:hypothetical protein